MARTSTTDSVCNTVSEQVSGEEYKMQVRPKIMVFIKQHHPYVTITIEKRQQFPIFRKHCHRPALSWERDKTEDSNGLSNFQ